MTDEWLAIRLDILSNIVVAVVAFLGVCLKDSVNAGFISLGVIYVLQLTNILQYTVRLSVDVENNMTSAERLMHFTTIPSEREYRKPVDSNWPSEGAISFQQVKLKYRSDLDLVLKGVSFDIRPREKIGVCGRTGSGKSTTMLALFRVVELEGGRITIDGIDISTLGLGNLRENICIIPQDPVLLSGSVRFNLDVTHKLTNRI
jgi:ABC-type multidrug transport system fused ATPase/permease subunit